MGSAITDPRPSQPGLSPSGQVRGQIGSACRRTHSPISISTQVQETGDGRMRAEIDLAEADCGEFRSASTKLIDRGTSRRDEACKRIKSAYLKSTKQQHELESSWRCTFRTFPQACILGLLCPCLGPLAACESRVQAGGTCKRINLKSV
jgi:hypothetical protein